MAADPLAPPITPTEPPLLELAALPPVLDAALPPLPLVPELLPPVAPVATVSSSLGGLPVLHAAIRGSEERKARVRSRVLDVIRRQHTISEANARCRARPSAKRPEIRRTWSPVVQCHTRGGAESCRQGALVSRSTRPALPVASLDDAKRQCRSLFPPSGPRVARDLPLGRGML
jgi:hypothetical protein